MLEGRSAIVTGGGSGIGAGIAKRLAEQGAKVVLVGRTLEKLENIAGEISSAGGEALTFAADVRKYDLLENAVKMAVDRFGSLDVAIASAAGNFLAPASTLSANGFRSVIDIDLCGTFNLARASFERPGTPV